MLDDHIIDVGENTIEQLNGNNDKEGQGDKVDPDDCFYRIFISKPGDFRDSTKYTFIGDFGSFEYAQRFIRHMYHDDDFPNPDTIVMKIPIRPVSVKNGVYDAVISCMGEVLRMDWNEMK